MISKSVFVLTAFVTIAASVTATAAVSVAATPIAKSVATTPISTAVTKSPAPLVWRTIPRSLGWTCVKNTLTTGYSCTDPQTGKVYYCAAPDPITGETICDVGDDTIPGSGKL